MLKRKMLRDIKKNLSQFITIFLMVCIGVMAFSGIKGYMTGMEYTADKFYTENNLQDLNVMGENFTDEDLEEIKNLANVKDAERRLVVNANLPDKDALNLSFIESNNIGKLYIADGENFDVNKKGIWLDEFYARENGIKLGDTVEFDFDKYTFKEKVLGFINAPDHLYELKDASELIPDKKTFGFAYLSINELQGYIENKAITENHITKDILKQMDFDYKDNLVFNTVVVDVNSKENVTMVKDAIEEKIDSAVAVIKAEDTTSYVAYQGEIDEGKAYVGIFSGLFIFIAMLSVITTMTRVVKNQRVQIGTLKALGVKNYKIILHYISYGLIISIIASILGLILGYNVIGKIFMSMQMTYFEIPNGVPVMTLESYICAIGVIALVCLVSYLTCRKTLKQNAAETLRNEIPSVKEGSLDITTKKMFSKMSFSTKWNIRDMFRNKLRTITAIVGIASSAMLIVCGMGLLDSLNNFTKMQFEDLYNFDYKLTLEQNITDEELDVLESKYGNNTSQTYMIEYKNKDGEKVSNNIFVMNKENDKIRFMNEDLEYIKLDSKDGVYVTCKFAKINNLKVGDTISWHLVGNDKYYESKIVGFNKDPQNQNMTMTEEYFESLGNEYKPDSLYTDVDLSSVKEIENVELIQEIGVIRESVEVMLDTMKGMVGLIVFISVILGIVIIYNMAVLSYTEKEYQFATLKVLGFQDKDIRKIFVKQNKIISVISVIIGLPLGYQIVKYVYTFVVDEAYDMVPVVAPITYIVAAVGVFLMVLLVSKLFARKINKIDMVSSLKGNE